MEQTSGTSENQRGSAGWNSMSIRIFTHHVQLPVLLLLLLEAAVAVLALYFIVGNGDGLSAAMPAWACYGLFAGVLAVSSAAMGLYNTRLREGQTGIALRLGLAALVSLGVLATLTVLIPGFEITLDKYALALVIAITGDFVLRFGFSAVLREDLFKRRVLVFGAGRQGASIANLKRRSEEEQVSRSRGRPARSVGCRHRP